MANIIGPIPLGKTYTVMDEAPSAAGSITREFSIEADSVLVSLYVESISGDIDVQVYTLTEQGKELEVITFPTISSPTTELLLEKAAAVMSRIKIVATFTAATVFEIRAKGISAGETSVRILGSAQGKTSQIDVGTGSPTILIPSALSFRAGVMIKNYSSTGVLYLGYTLAEAVTGNGWPLEPGQVFTADMASGAVLYGLADSGTIDVRIMEAST